jgi:predicted RNase H-like HicB family nuclease
VVYYVGILDGSKDVWGVRIPDVRGCYGGGATPEAAIVDATSALREFAAHQASKGIALNPPRSPQAVKADPAAEFDAGAGESFVMVPLILDHARPVKANISLDAGELEAIDQAAEARGLTRSAFVTSAALSKIVDASGSTTISKLRTELAEAHELLARRAAYEMREDAVQRPKPEPPREFTSERVARLAAKLLTEKHPALKEEEVRELAASVLKATHRVKGSKGSRSRSKSSS